MIFTKSDWGCPTLSYRCTRGCEAVLSRSGDMEGDHDHWEQGVELVWQYISQVCEGIVSSLVAHTTQIYHYLYTLMTRSMQNMFGTSAARRQHSSQMNVLLWDGAIR